MINPFKSHPNHPLGVLSDQDFSVFIGKIGLIFLNAPAAAALARHKRPLNTMKDYLDISPGKDQAINLAKEYTKDILTLTTEQLALKWFGKSSKDLAQETASLLDEDL